MLTRAMQYWTDMRQVGIPFWQRVIVLAYAAGYQLVRGCRLSIDRATWYQYLPFVLNIPVKTHKLSFVLQTKNPINLAFNTEQFCFELYNRVKKHDGVIMDLGAEIGAFSLFAAKKTNNEARIYAFEPEPFNLQELQQNCEHNACALVRIVPFAVSDRQGTIKLYKDNPLTHSIYGNKNNPSLAVRATTIDEFCKKNNIPRIDFMKINIEGAELKALKGAKRILKHTARILIGIHTFLDPTLEKNVCTLLGNAGFTLRSLPTPYPEHPWYLATRP